MWDVAFAPRSNALAYARLHGDGCRYERQIGVDLAVAKQVKHRGEITTAAQRKPAVEAILGGIGEQVVPTGRYPAQIGCILRMSLSCRFIWLMRARSASGRRTATLVERMSMTTRAAMREIVGVYMLVFSSVSTIRDTSQ